jgi:hypothetical protein
MNDGFPLCRVLFAAIESLNAAQIVLQFRSFWGVTCTWEGMMASFFLNQGRVKVTRVENRNQGIVVMS